MKSKLLASKLLASKLLAPRLLAPRLLAFAMLCAAAPTYAQPAYAQPADAQPGAAPAEIKIGALYASSGPYASISMPVFDGFKLWVDQVNAEGGAQVGAFGK